MNRKIRRLKRTKVYYPVIAIMGKQHHTDFMPLDYGKSVDKSQNIKLTKNKGIKPVIKRWC